MSNGNVRYIWMLKHTDITGEFTDSRVFYSYQDAFNATKENWPIYLLRRTISGATLRAPVSWEGPFATDHYPSLDRYFEGSAIVVPNKYRLEIRKVHLDQNKKEAAHGHVHS